MTQALILFGGLCLVLLVFWQRRIEGLDTLFAWFYDRFGKDNVDLTGQTEYTRCISHKWAMENIVRSKHSKRGEALQGVMMDSTLAGTLIVGMILGASPVIIVMLLFQSFILAGESIFIMFAAVYIIQGSGSVEVSYDFLKWLAQQELHLMKEGDLAFAEISRQAITKWQKTLAALAVASILIAPWGNLIMEGFALAIVAFYQGFLTYIFLPIAAFSFPAALLLLIAFLPIVLGLLYVVGMSIKKRTGRYAGKFPI